MTYVVLNWFCGVHVFVIIFLPAYTWDSIIFKGVENESLIFCTRSWIVKGKRPAEWCKMISTHWNQKISLHFCTYAKHLCCCQDVNPKMLNPRSSVPYNIFHSKTNPIFIFQSEHLSRTYASTNCAVDTHLCYKNTEVCQY